MNNCSFNRLPNLPIPMYTLLYIVLILAILGLLPVFPYSNSWGYYPSGGLGLVLLVVILLAVFKLV